MADEHRWTGPGDDEGPAWSVLQEFASVVSHELRTPLAIVKQAAETARHHQDSFTPEEHARYLDMIVRNGDLALLLLERIGLARDIEQGTVDLSTQEIDLAELVRESVSDLEVVLLSEHPTEVSAPEQVIVLADPTAGREIVFNLLSNAAKYSDAGAPIEITVTAVDSVAQVVVRNHGGGVTPGDTERIFEKFERLDSGAPGTGLGLFISRGLARAHGGDIQVQPAQDVGSEFILTLPM
ncbi:MAG: HAMP domain-containing sensor histidine kinase [Nitriliruptorales bacterium]|nr:HAMP domain-containing sensor histidine kinase [Nitriliruptorales bacterium]